MNILCILFAVYMGASRITSTLSEPANSSCNFSLTSISCIKAQGQFLPRNLSPHIHVLYIVDSDMTSLEAEDFSSLKHLDTLYIDSSSILVPQEENLLSELENLKTLEIINTTVTGDVFKLLHPNSHLTKLALVGNSINHIRKDVLQYLRYVESIDVSHNEISKIDDGAFEGLGTLKELDLSYNRIGEKLNQLCSGEHCSYGISEKQEMDSTLKYLWEEFKDKDVLYMEKNPICSVCKGSFSESDEQSEFPLKTQVVKDQFVPDAVDSELEQKKFFDRMCNDKTKRKQARKHMASRDNVVDLASRSGRDSPNPLPPPHEGLASTQPQDVKMPRSNILRWIGFAVAMSAVFAIMAVLRIKEIMAVLRVKSYADTGRASGAGKHRVGEK